MRIIAAIAVVTLIAAIAQPASAGMVKDCLQGQYPDLQLLGCTAMIRSGEYSGKDLALAYKNRGNAYFNLDKHRQAIESYDQALRIYPEYQYAYSGRGDAYDSLGEYRRAIQDYDQALRIYPGDHRTRAHRAEAYNK